MEASAAFTRSALKAEVSMPRLNNSLRKNPRVLSDR